MKSAALLLVGMALVVAGWLLPQQVTPAPRVTALVGLGRHAGVPRLTAPALSARAQAPITARELAPSVVELSAPVEERAALEALLAAIPQGAVPASACALDAPGCAVHRLNAVAVNNTAVTVLDPPVVARGPTPRVGFLLGMAVLLAGVALVALGLRRGGVEVLPGRAGVAAFAAACGVAGASAGAVLGSSHTQDVVITVAMRVHLPEDPPAWNPWQASEDVQARVASAPFLDGLTVEVRALHTGSDVWVLLRAEDKAQLAAAVERLRERVLRAEEQKARDTLAELELLKDAPDKVVAEYAADALRRFSTPGMQVGPVVPDARGPGLTGAAAAVAGALVAWALGMRRRQPR